MTELCRIINPDYPSEARCTYPKGHGKITEAEFDVFEMDHGSPEAGAWWTMPDKYSGLELTFHESWLDKSRDELLEAMAFQSAMTKVLLAQEKVDLAKIAAAEKPLADALAAVGLPKNATIDQLIQHHRANAGVAVAFETAVIIAEQEAEIARLRSLLPEA